MKRISELDKYGIDSVEVQKCVDTYTNHEITVTVTGEFSSGKSCFINAVLGKSKMLPENDSECTPVYIDLSAGTKDSLLVIYNNGKSGLYELSADNLDKFAKYRKGTNEDVLALNITLKDFPLNSRLHLLDTPGTNTIIGEHEQITSRVLRSSDIVIYVFNKMITESDCKNIRKIYKRNKDIIFVMTHIDNSTGSEYLADNIISKYMTEARANLLNLLGIEPSELKLFPIGSLRALSDRTYLDPIINHLNYTAEQCGEKILKTNARRKITDIINSAVSKKEDEIKVLREAKMMDSDKLEEQINQAEKKLSVFNKEIDRVQEEMSENAKASLGRIGDKIKRVSDNSVRSLSTQIENLDFDVADTESILKQKIDSACEKYESEVTKVIKDGIYHIVNDEYKNISEKLQDAKIEFSLFENFELTCPQIFTDNSDDFEGKAALLRKINECERELAALEEMKEIEQDEYKRRCELISQKREKCELAIQRRREVGPYQPKMNSVYEESGGEMGKKIGRMVGEIADIALVLYNPSGAAAESAGEAAKIAAEGAQVVDKTKDIAKLLQYGASVMANVSKTADTVKSAAETVATTSGGGAWGKVANILDILSVGHWFEKIGEQIGDAVKPSHEYTVEDQAEREKYFRGLEEINKEISLIKSEIRSDEAALGENPSIVNAKKRAELDRKKKRLEDELEKQREYNEKLAKQKRNDIIVGDYTESIRKIFKAQTEENIGYARELVDSTVKLAAKAVRDDFADKLSEAGEEISRLKKGKEGITSSIEEIEGQLRDFGEIRESVDIWLAEID